MAKNLSSKPIWILHPHESLIVWRIKNQNEWKSVMPFFSIRGSSLNNNKSINPYACKDLAIKMKNTKKQYIKINPVLQLKIVYYHRVVVTLKTLIILIIFFLDEYKVGTFFSNLNLTINSQLNCSQERPKKMKFQNFGQNEKKKFFKWRTNLLRPALHNCDQSNFDIELNHFDIHIESQIPV